ncbi:uncharacterized protein N7482_002300 [Penicillium canariense]|uniref:Uncharacterized protein n=1 Tax=Penicillium canariense TaxID=189055 RepID=A0A9W9IF01_9EURO|nr:uncharacterized protein N7482_002300 [Penicillium canariense]KAJ5176423.1 hypothetical protein N7482_002300 [Penicillium canariense]
MPHHLHADVDRVMRHSVVRREVIPSDRLPFLVPSIATAPGAGFPSLIARAPASSETTGTSDCGSSGCTKPTSNLTTTVLPVVLGAGVPILCAIVVLIFLHRRHVKKLMREDANDKHKSLDFGMDMVGPPSGKGRKLPNGLQPQMMEPSHAKGLSLDVSPYLMPPGLHGSRESLHSLSRSIDDDKYRPAVFGSQDNGSLRSFPRNRGDDGSSLRGSTRHGYGGAEEPNSGLLRNAQRMSRSSPPRYNNPPGEGMPQRPLPAHQQDHLGPAPGLTAAPSEHNEHAMAIGSATTDHSESLARAASPPGPQFHPNNAMSELHFEIEPPMSHANTSSQEERLNFPLPHHSPSYQEFEQHPQTSTPMQLPRISLPSSDITSSDYGDDRKSDLMIPAVNVHGAEEHQPHHDNKLPELPEEPSQNHLDLAFDSNNRRDTRRLTLGVRPLPPEDPADNPEQRANRIRSFYKEYFDDSKRETTYYEDNGSEFYDGGYVYDPTTGDYYDAAAPPAPPFAEPIGRRAMTPPPRAPPRFQGAARHMATNSAGFNGVGGPGPRAFSSASGRLPGPRGPRKPMPPPAPLQMLPTPAMLKDDSFLMAADFAPGTNVRDRREGRPETPTGGSRPYSPAIRAHTPLASAFDELAVIPSAHALRKSGTDAGSIRSNRTGISNTHMNNIRMGNYRVSRLPTDMVGTKDDLLTSLRPDWDMGKR